MTGRTTGGGARFLVVTWDGGGNTNPAFNLGTRLEARGHDVTLLGWSGMDARAAAAGLGFVAYPSLPVWPAGRSMDDGWEDVWQMLNGPEAERDIVRAAADHRPDAMVVDSMMGATFRAAATVGVPFAALVHTLYRPFASGWGDMVMRTDAAALLASAHRVLALEPPGLDELPTPLPDNTHVVGPVALLHRAADVAFLDEPGAPWVLISLSTTLQQQAQALPGMLKAVASLPVRALLTVGGGIAPGDVDAPANVTVRGFLPHEAVLPHMAAVLTHAGLSTVAAALAAGVPLVCVPQGRDQPMNAARVASVGAGVVVDAGAAPDELAAAVDRVRTDPAMRSAARAIAAQVAALGYGAVATDLVESMVARPG